MRKKFIISLIITSIFIIVLFSTYKAVFIDADFVYGRFWVTLNENYYKINNDNFNFSDIENNFRPKNKNSEYLYDYSFSNILNIMPSSHFYITPPPSVVSKTGKIIFASTGMDISPSNLICSGVVISSFRSIIRPQIIGVDKQSPLSGQGIGLGWRFVAAETSENDSSNIILTLYDNGGKIRKFHIRKNPYILSDIEKIYSEMRYNLNPDRNITLPNLGIISTSGRDAQLPEVSYIIPNSQAVNERVSIGDKVKFLETVNGGKETHIVFTKKTNEEIKMKIKNSCVKDGLFGKRDIKVINKNISYVRFDRFDKYSLDWLQENVKYLSNDIIIDFRRNRGGLISVLENFLGMFLGPDKNIGSDIRRFTTITEKTPSDSQKINSGRIVILLGKATASSAEIASDILRLYRGAIIVGETSSGQVLTSSSFSLPDNGKVVLPIGEYRDPSGMTLEGVGVSPDQVINSQNADQKETDFYLELSKLYLTK
ncbi:hypothetical protein J2D73_13660 [Acetobacter sacchari]|uniref:Tail specific protease domain-containing protein n=1 Tax=Acetobacter sacchari TaxID=2661687 RepID=A0ABS3LY41_9PROT|nr:S41 family peptidase [Acetobacter sacchari]MBO1360832.1 hypothetical protein [Acetobacter sacchari]